MPEYLTPNELCARYKGAISPRTLANWRSQRIGPAFVKIGGRVLYAVEAVLRWESGRAIKLALAVVCYKIGRAFEHALPLVEATLPVA